MNTVPAKKLSIHQKNFLMIIMSIILFIEQPKAFLIK